MKTHRRRPLVAPFRTGSLAFAVALAFAASPASGDELGLHEAEVSRIEAHIEDDHYAATQSARALRHRLEEQLVFERGFQIDQHDRAERWNRLAESVLHSAADAESNAVRWSALAEDASLHEDDRQARRDWAASELDAAGRLREQAQDMLVRAEEFATHAAELKPAIANLVALIDRLDRVLRRDRQAPQIVALEGDRVPSIPFELALSPHYDDLGYFTGWNITADVIHIDTGDAVWEGDASFLPDALVRVEGQPNHVGVEAVVQFFRNMVPSIIARFDPEEARFIPREFVEHSASGPAFIEHLTAFSEQTADTLERHRIHRDQFEPFFDQFVQEYRRIFNYQIFLSERLLRRNTCESIDTGVQEEWRDYYCGNNRIPYTGDIRTSDFLISYRSEMYWALGVDPWAYMEEIAQHSRPDPLLSVCVPVLEHPTVSALVADFQAEIKAAQAHSQEFWEDANRHYQQEWLPVRLSFEFEDGEGMP